jgi:hypothetical protein
MKVMLATILCLLPLAGCSGWVVVISPTGIGCDANIAVVSTPIRPVPTINTGVTVHGTLSSCHVADEFNVAVVTGGTLVVSLEWDTAQASTLSMVTLNGVEFRSGTDGAPLVAKVPATQGQQYRLRVALHGSDEIPEDRYQLTTALE